MDAYRPGPSESRVRWSRERGGSWLGWGVAIVVALVVLAVIFLFMNNEPPQRVAIADLEDDVSPMTGASVTVEGEVEEALSEQALTVRDGESDEPLLVITHSSTIIDGVAPIFDQVDPLGAQTDLDGVGQVDPVDPVTAPEPIAPAIPTSGPIRVIGTVDTFDLAAVSEQLGITLGADAFASFEDDPYLLADQIETSFDPSTIPPEEAPVTDYPG